MADSDNQTRRLTLLVAALAVTLAVLRWLPITPIIAYTTVFIASSIVYWLIANYSLRVDPSPRELFPLLLLLLIVRVSFIGMAPLGSDDVYRYVWDGRVQSAGINPYSYAPNDQALSDLRTPELPSLVNHPEMKTIYFPLSQWIFYLGYHLGGEHVWGFQVFILLAEVLTLLGLLLLMKELSYSPWRVLIYAANPLIILQFSLDTHVDAFGFPFLVFALLFFAKGRKNLSLVFFGLSLLIKPVALVILPLLFFHERGLLNKAKTLVIPFAVFFIPFLPYIFSANPFEALTAFTKHWYFNGALFSALYPFFSDNQTTRLWCFAILAVLLAILYLSNKSLHEKMVLAVLLLLLCSPVAHPWYFGWLVLILPLAPLASGLALAALASLPSITFVTYQLNGIWRDYPLILILEYVPVLLLLIWDLRKKPIGMETAG